jgi:hypothetical protein
MTSFKRAHIVWIVLAVVVALLVMIMQRPREGYRARPDKETCKKKAGKSTWNQYYFTQRKYYENKDPKWQCPLGWQDTGCSYDIGVGTEYEKKQCRRHKNKPASKERKGGKCKKSNECSGTRFCYAMPKNIKTPEKTTGWCKYKSDVEGIPLIFKL